MVEALAEHLRRYTAKQPDAFVFLSSQGKHAACRGADGSLRRCANSMVVVAAKRGRLADRARSPTV